MRTQDSLSFGINDEDGIDRPSPFDHGELHVKNQPQFGFMTLGIAFPEEQNGMIKNPPMDGFYGIKGAFIIGFPTLLGILRRPRIQ